MPFLKILLLCPSPPLMPPDKRPLLVSISAHALSSVGFGLSIIAIWVHWLFPPCDESTQDQLIHQPVHKGRKQPSALSQRGTISPNSRDARSPRHTKHVNFADADKKGGDVKVPVDIPPHDVTVPATHSPTSSSSTIMQPTDEKQKVSAKESPISACKDAAPKSDGFFARRNPCKKRRTGSLNEKSLRIFRTVSPLDKLSSRVVPPRSATFSFGTRHDTRPVPRTMPYGPPYFATPPCPIGDVPFLKESRAQRQH